MTLEHIETTRRSRYHRYPCVLEVVNETYVGPRGGKKIPLAIEWEQSGTGFFASVFKICGCTTLFPQVRYHNGNGKPRKMPVREWVELTGKGSFRYLDDEERAAFDAALKVCKDAKSVDGARTADIVMSILKNGGTATLRSTT